MTVILQVKVKPNSQRSLLEQMPDGTWLPHLKSPPVDGRANTELIELVSRHFNCPKSAVIIKSGKSGRIKRLMIEC
ncbi:MAG: DUF167 domain-containing protein [Pseudanabaenaceae cyanobacterium]